MLYLNHYLKEEYVEDKVRDVESRCKYIYNKYRDEFDTLSEVRDVSDYLSKLYLDGGMEAVNNWFLPAATKEYKDDFKKLIYTLNESQEDADDAYYKVNEVSLKLQELKPLIKDNTEADKLYTDINIALNSLQMALYKEKLNESSFKDDAGKDGIHSYFDMLYGQEPQSEYDKMMLQYMHTSDEIREKLADAKAKYGTKSPEFRKIQLQLSKEDERNSKLKVKAEKIPVEDRGPLYKDYLEIEKANDDEFARQRGYNSYDEYEKHMFECSKLSESDNPELTRVLHDIQDEMKYQEYGSYDLNSNDENEMYKFIDKAVKPIVNNSNLDDSLKKEIVGWMEVDIRDNKKWSIKTGVKAIMDWYKVK